MEPYSPFHLGPLVVPRSHWSEVHAGCRDLIFTHLITSPYKGIFGSLLIKLNVRIAVYRENSPIRDWPILEVVCVSAVTAAVSYLVSYIQWSTSLRSSFCFRLFLRGMYYPRCDETLFLYEYRVQSSELVANLFQECDPTKGDYHGLCKYDA